MTTYLKAFWTGGSGKDRVATFTPSMHSNGDDLKGTQASPIDNWYADSGDPVDDMTVITNDVCETSDYKNVLRGQYTGAASSGGIMDYAVTVDEPCSIRMGVAFDRSSCDVTDSFFITLEGNAVLMVDFKATGDIFYSGASDTGINWTDDEFHVIEWRFYHDNTGTEQTELLIDDTHIDTWAYDFSGCTYISFNSLIAAGSGGGTMKMYCFFIECSNTAQYTGSRSNRKWSEISDTITNLQGPTRRMDDTPTCELTLHNPHHSLISTYKDAAKRQIAIGLFDDSTGTCEWLFIGAIYKAIFRGSNCTLECKHLAAEAMDYKIDVARTFVGEYFVSNVAATVLTLVDDEGNSPGFTVDNLIGDVLIFEDKVYETAFNIRTASSGQVTNAAGAGITPIRQYYTYLQTKQMEGGWWVKDDAVVCQELSIPITGTVTHIKARIFATHESLLSAANRHTFEIYDDNGATWETKITFGSAYERVNQVTEYSFEINDTETPTNYVSGGGVLKLRIKWNKNNKHYYEGGIIYCEVQYSTSNVLILGTHDITDNDANTITCGASNFVNANAVEGDKVLVLKETSDLRRAVANVSGLLGDFLLWEDVDSTQLSIPSSGVFASFELQFAEARAVHQSLNEIEKSRFWFDRNNDFDIATSWSASGVTINEDDILNPLDMEVTSNEDEMCNRAKFYHASGVSSDWKEDQTSIETYGEYARYIQEANIKNKHSLDTLATNYVANHKDREVLIRNCLVIRNTAIDIGTTVSFTAFGLTETLLVEGIIDVITVGKSPVQKMILELGNAPLNRPPAEQLGIRIGQMKSVLYQSVGVLDKSIKDITRHARNEYSAHEIYGAANEKISTWHDGTDAHVKSSAGDINLIPKGELNIIPNEDSDDYVQVYTSSNTPRIKRVGGTSLYFETDDTDWSQILTNDDDSNFMAMSFHKTSHYGRLYSTGSIYIMPSGDGDDYLSVSTTSNVSHIMRIGHQAWKKFDVLPMPSNFITAGNNNAYWLGYYGAETRFGITAYGSGTIYVTFRVPQDYKVGTDILLVFHAYGLTAAIATIDSSIYVQCKGNGEANGWQVVNCTTCLSPASAGHGNNTTNTFTLADATLGFAKEEVVNCTIGMDDNAATSVLCTHGWSVYYQSEEIL